MTQLLDTRVSIYSTFDTRFKVDIESHLPVSSSVSLVDGVQQTSRHIAEAYFEKKCKITSNTNDNLYKITTPVYTGQIPMIRKDTQNKAWYKLNNSYGLRFLRFYVFITYRVFSGKENKWTFQRYRMKLEEDDYFNFSVRFVSTQ